MYTNRTRQPCHLHHLGAFLTKESVPPAGLVVSSSRQKFWREWLPGWTCIVATMQLVFLLLICGASAVVTAQASMGWLVLGHVILSPVLVIGHDTCLLGCYSCKLCLRTDSLLHACVIHPRSAFHPDRGLHNLYPGLKTLRAQVSYMHSHA